MIIDGSLIKTLDLEFLKEYSNYFEEDSIDDKPLPKLPPGLNTPPIAKTPEPRFFGCGSPDILDMFMYPQFDSESESEDRTSRQLEEAAVFMQRYQKLKQEDSVSLTNQNIKHASEDCKQTYQLVQHSSTASNRIYQHLQNQTVTSMPTHQQVEPESSASMYRKMPPESSSLVPLYQQVQRATTITMSGYSNHPMPTSATISYQQHIPSPSYQQHIPSSSYQQNLPSPSYQQNLPSPSYQQNLSSPSYQQNLPSPSYQQNLPSPAYHKHNTTAPSPKLFRQQQIATSPASVPVNTSTSTNSLISGLNHQPVQEPATTKGKGRRPSKKANESNGVFETPNSPVKKRGRKRTVTSAAPANGVQDQQPQTKQPAVQSRAPRGRPPGKAKPPPPVSGSVQPNGQAGDPNVNALLLNHQQLFPALAQLLCQPHETSGSNSQLQYAQTSNRNVANVNAGNGHLRQSVISVGNGQTNKPPVNSEQVFYYQTNPTNQRNNSQPVSIQNFGQFRNLREPTVFSLDNQRTVIQGYNSGVPGYMTTPLVLSSYQNGCLQISPQSSSAAVHPAPFVMQQDSGLPQQPFVVNLMTPPDSNLTPSPASSSSTPSPEVLSGGHDYCRLKYRLM